MGERREGACGNLLDIFHISQCRKAAEDLFGKTEVFIVSKWAEDSRKPTYCYKYLNVVWFSYGHPFELECNPTKICLCYRPASNESTTTPLPETTRKPVDC